MKKYIILLIGIFGLCSCATNNNQSPNTNNNGVTTYGNQPDNPNVNSRAASSVEFPQENQQ